MDNLTTVRVEKSYIVYDVIAIVISVVGVFMNVTAMAAIYVAVRDKRPVHRLLINDPPIFRDLLKYLEILGI